MSSDRCVCFIHKFVCFLNKFVFFFLKNCIASLKKDKKVCVYKNLIAHEKLHIANLIENLFFDAQHREYG